MFIEEIGDMDYKSYTLPCYPFEEHQQKEGMIKGFEGEALEEIGDMDYCLQIFPYNLSKWQLAA